MTTTEQANELRVPPIGFGMWDDVAQTVKDAGGLPVDKDDDRDTAQLAVLHQAIKLGYRHFDTAEMYAAGHSERILGRALLEQERSDFMITSKVSAENLAYDDLLAACDRSLDRLQTSYIDMYLIHWPNPEIPLTESFRALNHLVNVGKIRHIGVSNFSVPLLEQAVQLCETHLATNQVYYGLLNRKRQEDGTLKFCQGNKIVLTAYAPLRGGVLTHQTVLEIAERISATPSQVALNWLIRQPGVITIPHSSNEQRQKDNLEATNIQLNEADVQHLDMLGAG
jgi:diketogulonate reductase-like aldo/keto reductase|tara:strand:+ start:320 stop:1165 length:846 start_codon:yes stop_codon:yes gene_type:complete